MDIFEVQHLFPVTWLKQTNYKLIFIPTSHLLTWTNNTGLYVQLAVRPVLRERLQSATLKEHHTLICFQHFHTNIYCHYCHQTLWILYCKFKWDQMVRQKRVMRKYDEMLCISSKLLNHFPQKPNKMIDKHVFTNSVLDLDQQDKLMFKGIWVSLYESPVIPQYLWMMFFQCCTL